MKILLAVLVGGVIGYFTNWIAIRMLFRPYEEKIVFGRKLPFTPGMIPKERYRIAHSVGQTVEDYLLRPEKIMEVILSKESEERFSVYLKKRLAGLRKENIEVGSYLSARGLDIEKLKKTILPDLEKVIIKVYNKKRNKLRFLIGDVYDQALAKIQDYFEDNPDLLDTYIETNMDKINKFAIEILELYKDKNKLLSDYIDDDKFIELRGYILSNDIELVEKFREAYKKKTSQDLLREFVSNLVEKNVSRLITTIVGPDLIVDKILSAIDDYIYSNRVFILLEKVALILEDKIKDIKISTIINFLESAVQAKILNRIFLRRNFVEELSRFLKEALKREFKEKRTKFIDYIDLSLYDYINSSLAKEDIKIALEALLFYFLSIDISSLLGRLSGKNIERLVSYLFEYIRKIDDDIIERIIKKLNISKLVEEEVNSFPIDLGEEIILDIAGKELRAITNLGAFIGGFIGLLSYILQN